MNGATQDHVRRAKDRLDEAIKRGSGITADRQIAVAQVEATLALVSATDELRAEVAKKK